MSEVKVIRKREAKNFLEGDEHCRLYVKTENTMFGTSALLPGRRGAVDPGHKEGHEIFFVAKGRVICHLPKLQIYEELEEGDVIIIPPGEPHELINVGHKEAIICWSLTPPF